MNLDELLRQMLSRRVSDVHLQAGSPPTGRVDGQLTQFGGQMLMPPDTQALAQSILSADQWEDFEYRNELDTAYSVPGLGRFRCNIFRQRGAVGIVMRVVGDSIPNFESLGLPVEVLRRFSEASRGLILVTGPTGAGKSTTMASMVDHINRTFAYNIITIEDPIEILHRNQRSLVVQREVGTDTRDFRNALKYAMRQDPDVILIGEMRDKETVEAALTAAQTGHLVLSHPAHPRRHADHQPDHRLFSAVRARPDPGDAGRFAGGHRQPAPAQALRRHRAGAGPRSR